MKRLALIVTMFILMASPSAFAETPVTIEEKMSAISQELNLTDEQITQLAPLKNKYLVRSKQTKAITEAEIEIALDELKDILTFTQKRKLDLIITMHKAMAKIES
ncbi:MAG: hypothetical protein O3A01_07675 [bacterium]|nr:hypothetical protein [bacterium]